jgi:predicted nucleic acid-binding protein
MSCAVMSDPLLIDTSVWIDFFKGIDTENVKIFTYYMENDFPVFICPVIIQEILQGIKSDKEYARVKDNLFALNVLNDDAIEAAIGAAEIFRILRKKGVTIRKSNDCLIAFYALKYSLKILHNDRDFDKILLNYT